MEDIAALPFRRFILLLDMAAHKQKHFGIGAFFSALEKSAPEKSKASIDELCRMGICKGPTGKRHGR